jgi:ABC-2 type transport system ATP-binding protein
LARLPTELAALHVELAGPSRLVFHYQPSRTRVADFLAALGAAGLTIVDVTTVETDLHDIFLQLTGSARAQP